jgi:hypothetical protein
MSDVLAELVMFEQRRAAHDARLDAFERLGNDAPCTTRTRKLGLNLGENQRKQTRRLGSEMRGRLKLCEETIESHQQRIRQSLVGLGL